MENLFTNQINPDEHPFSVSSTPCASPAIFSSAVKAKPSNSFPATTWPIMQAYHRFKAEKNAMPSPSVSNWKAAISSLYRSTIHQPASLADRHFRTLPDSGRYRSSGHRAGQGKPIPDISSIGHAFKSRFSRPARITFRRPEMIGRHNAVTTVYFRYNSAIHSDA